MIDLSNPAVVRGILERHGLRLSKGLGQNFLINPTCLFYTKPTHRDSKE